MRKLLYIFAISLLTQALTLAQTSFRIRGYVLLREDSTALINALVEAYAGDRLIARALSDDKGYFELKCSSPIKHLSLLYLGSKQSINTPKVLGADTDLGRVYVASPNKKLAAVEVVAQLPLCRYEAGKSIYNLNALPGLQGASLLEAIQRIPVLEFNPQEGLILNGFEKLVVLHDKRRLNMSVQELEAYLASLPSSDISSIELIPNPSSDYDTQGLPVLNIISNKHSEDGYNAYANLRATYKYYMSGQLNARINLNKGISRSYMSYSIRGDRSRETTTLGDNVPIHTDVYPKIAHYLSIGTLLKFGEKHSIDANMYGSFVNEHYSYNVSRSSRLERPHLFASLRHTYRNGRIDLQSVLDGSWATLGQRYESPNAEHLRDTSTYLRISPRLTYRLSSKLNLQGGISYELTNYRSQSAPNSFSLRDQHTALDLGLSWQVGQMYLQGSLSANQYATRLLGGYKDLEYKRLRLLPRLTIQYNWAKKHSLTFEGKSSYTRPNFGDINVLQSPSTASWGREGNVDLQAEYKLNLALRYSFLRAAQLELSYADTHSPIVELPIQQSVNSTILLRKINLDYSRYLRLLLVLPIPIVSTKGFNWLATTVVAWHTQADRGIVANATYQNSFSAYYINHKQSISFSNSWSIALSATMYGPLYLGLYEIEKTWWAEASLSKSIRSWRITASVRDPLNSNIARGSYTGQSSSIKFQRSWHSPQISLSVSYSFGNKSLKKYQEPSRSDATDRMRTTGDNGIALPEGR